VLWLGASPSLGTLMLALGVETRQLRHCPKLFHVDWENLFYMKIGVHELVHAASFNFSRFSHEFSRN
jgi:hypothetical protein